MSRTEKALFGVLVFVAALIWGAIAWQKWQEPLGPALALPSLTPAPAVSVPASVAPSATDQPSPAAKPTRRPTSTATATATAATSATPYLESLQNAPLPLCGAAQTSMLLLAIGSDTRSGAYLYGLADVIRLVRVDYTLPRVTVLEIPRDIWVQIPDLAPEHGISEGKLNQAYLYGNEGMGYYTGTGQGPGLLARTLQLNFGAQPQHYFAANMQTFVKLVNNIGGLDVYLPKTVDGRKADQTNRWDLYFKAGAHHLNGQQALMLARIRQISTFERAQNQNIVLCAVRDALLNPYNLPKLPQIIQTFDGAVQTDLSPQQMSQLACLMPLLKSENIQFISLPREYLKETRTFDPGVGKEVFIFEADFNAIRFYILAFSAGQIPALAQPAPTGTPGAPLTPAPSGGFQCP